MLLPVFGGAPAVWLVSMVFFQLVLLIGYGYGYLIGKLEPKVQGISHVLAFGLAGISIPLHARIVGSVHNPEIGVLLSLAATIGPAYALISPNSPVIQRWYTWTKEGRGVRPYFLYSASNIGSLLGLLAYPAIIEQRLTLQEQMTFFRNGYFLVTILLFVLAIVAVRGAPEASSKVEEEEHVAITAKDRWIWIAYAAIPTGLMLAVTSALTYNVAPIPLLWVLPLSLYLISYVVAFSSRINIPSQVLGRVVAILAPPMLVPIILESSSPLVPIICLHLIVFFMVAYMCHRRLAELAPPAGNSAEYYFFLALGGVMGSALVSLVFPIIANTYVEYPLFLAAACAVIPSKKDYRWNISDLTWGCAVFMLAVVVVLITEQTALSNYFVTDAERQARIGLCVGIPAIVAYLFNQRSLRFGLCILGTLIGLNLTHVAIGASILRMDRSFFGVHRVTGDSISHYLVHGNTTHGRQNTEYPLIPLTYYHHSGPIGQVLDTFGPAIQKCAFIGLGVGSLAAYGTPYRDITFFEIDPSVRDLASDPKLFTYLRDSKARNLNIVIGDGRQELAKEEGPYDLIVVDAFSSDSIPSHLLTIEAMQMYMSKLGKHGIIAYHTSNRYLKLADVVAAGAEKLGYVIRYQYHADLTSEEENIGVESSEWVLVARNDEAFVPLDATSVWDNMVPHEGVRPWTDDYSNLFDALLREMRD